MRAITILVADDEITVRTFIKMVVAKERLPVAACLETDNGLEAVRLAGEHRPDLVFLDIRMPGCDGLKAAAAILADNPRANVVIVSAYNEFDYARTALRAGVADYLLKPVRPAEVAALIVKTAAAAAAPDDAGRKPPLVAKVEQYIRANLDAPIKLRDIAQAVYLSQFHLSRTFKQLTGRSVVEYLQDQRLAKAGEMLAATDLSVTEIAGRVGFKDAAYFTTCFKNRNGVTPLQYRKNSGRR
ncbi:response regulator [Anaeroselena agilis]|uniref:Response regulator n=1 Tax=Anaeroselena agilis TaxID=3063788 RepID=A0ABU3NZ32_9FIRM|nr:response regulator [Selenomonadales bacterium 4137-cl]